MQYGDAVRAMEQPALFTVLLSFSCHLALSAGNSGELTVSSCCTLVGVQLVSLFIPVAQAVTLAYCGCYFHKAALPAWPRLCHARVQVDCNEPVG